MENFIFKLLNTTDLTEKSRHSTRRAAMLAQQIGAQLDLLYVLQKKALDEFQVLIGQDNSELQGSIRLQVEKELSQLIKNDVASYLGEEVNYHLIEGELLESIKSQINILDPDLLIMGAHGRDFVRQLVLGTTAERTLRMTLRPVLIVKQPPHEAYKSVLIPVDFSPWSLRAIKLALAVAPQAELILMHIYEVPFEGKLRLAGESEEAISRYREIARINANARLEQTAIEAGLDTHENWHSIVIRGDVERCILEQEEAQRADLIVLGKHGYGMIEELLLGSRTKQVLAQSKCDVLVSNY